MFRSKPLSVLLLAATAFAKIYYAGVNESGGEFGVYSANAVNGTGLPGRYGVDYQFINQANVQVFIDQGINLFRVCFLLERMCPLSYGLGAKFNETYFSEFQTAVNFITGKGAYAILDAHNYMRYNDPSQQPTTGSVIGNTTDPAAATTAQFQAFWTQMATRFVNNSQVIFGIMNEPHDMPTSLVLTNDQAAINGIRSTGAKQLIIAPGNGYTGGHSWNSSAGEQGDQPSSDYLYKLVDPAENTAIDIHEYLDTDFSGSHVQCVHSFQTELPYLTSWLKQHKLKAIISEFGGSYDPTCVPLIKQALNYMHNNDEYIGWSAWAAGPFWGSYSPCCDNYANNGSLEPGSTSAGGGPGFYQEVWQKLIQPKIPLTTLQRSGMSSIHGGPGYNSYAEIEAKFPDAVPYNGDD